MLGITLEETRFYREAKEEGIEQGIEQGIVPYFLRDLFILENY